MQKLAYEKLMEENQITFDELPQDAKTQINGIKKIVHALNMTEKRGQKPTSATMEKLRINDKHVVREILDYMEEVDSKQGPLPNNPDQVVEEIENAMSPEEKAKFDEGVSLEAELEVLSKAGKSVLSIDELKSEAGKCYAKIFKTYEDGQPNGIVTSKYSLIEDQTNLKTFNLKNN